MKLQAPILNSPKLPEHPRTLHRQPRRGISSSWGINWCGGAHHLFSDPSTIREGEIIWWSLRGSPANSDNHGGVARKNEVELPIHASSFALVEYISFILLSNSNNELVIFVQDVSNRSFLKSQALQETVDNRKLLAEKDELIKKRWDQYLNAEQVQWPGSSAYSRNLSPEKGDREPGKGEKGTPREKLVSPGESNRNF